MSLASRLQSCLYSSGVDFELVKHPPAATTLEAARRANIPAHNVAKSVVVKHIDGHAMAIVPSDRKVNLTALQDILHYRLGLSPEADVFNLFFDCAPGAIPPVGHAYGLKTLVDHEMEDSDWVYFEAGDHRNMVKMRQKAFSHLMGGVEHAAFSCTPY